MKVLGLVGSSRKGGNTDILVKEVLNGVQSENIDTQYIFLEDYKIADCTGCEGCKNTLACVIQDDMQRLYPLLEEADAIVLGSPTYFYNITAKVKSFLDRLYCYELFDESDRSVWMGLNEITGLKYGVTVAVCEQEDEADMGFTSPALSKPLEALGYRIVTNIKALHVYKKGSIKDDPAQLEKAMEAGVRLAKTLKLREKYKAMGR
jgi:multimeric flavodoxin WrbA